VFSTAMWPQPIELGGQRALDFVLRQHNLRDFNRNLLGYRCWLYVPDLTLLHGQLCTVLAQLYPVQPLQSNPCRVSTLRHRMRGSAVCMHSPRTNTESNRVAVRSGASSP
jgi:hypothetical protein